MVALNDAAVLLMLLLANGLWRLADSGNCTRAAQRFGVQLDIR